MPTIASSQLPPPGNWDEFEGICADLFSLEWNDRQTIRHGRSGQRQQGVDIHGRPADGNAGVQCKGKRRWPPVDLTVDEIDAQVEQALTFNPPLTEYIIATTANDDAALQKHARELTEAHTTKGLFSVQVLGWEELSRRIKSHDELIAKHYGYTSLSTVRKEIEALPTRIVDRLRVELSAQDAPAHTPGQAIDVIQPGVAEALERDFEAIDLVDYDDVDQPSIDILEQALQGRAVQVAAGIGWIIVASRQGLPTLRGLGLDVGLACLPLRMERIELKLQSMFGRFARIDRASLGLAGFSGHQGRSLSGRNPKNFGPLQRVLVIMRAISDRLS